MVESGHRPNSNQSFTGLRPNPEVIAQRLGDAIILVHLHTSEIYELNTTAARVWELLGFGRSLEEIKEQLLREFDTETTVLEQEAKDLLGLLEEKHLLVRD